MKLDSFLIGGRTPGGVFSLFDLRVGLPGTAPAAAAE
jgi:hypothetical protein